MMTKDVLSETRGKSYLNQQQILEKLTRLPFSLRAGVPTVLEAATCLSMEFVETAEETFKR